jgi:hypothetical protein
MLRSRVLTALALATLLVVAILFCPPSGHGVDPGTDPADRRLGVVGVPGALRALAAAVRARAGGAGTGRLALHAAERALPADARSWRSPGGWWRWCGSCAPRSASAALAAALAGALALLPTYLALVRIDELWGEGAQWTLFILALAFAADTGGFFAGRQFGRVHLAPRVSPNKTWEGVIGGMLLALACAGCRGRLVVRAAGAEPSCRCAWPRRPSP